MTMAILKDIFKWSDLMTLTKEEIEELNKRAYETCAWEITTEVEDERVKV